jgi:hypothetical protein
MQPVLCNSLSKLTAVSPIAFKLGIAGLIPFVVLAVLGFVVTDAYQNLIIFSLLAYGASISSFLGAIHWGLTMRDTIPNKAYLLWGVIPSLIGWVGLMLRPESGLLVITGLLWVCLLVDSKIYPKYALEHWLPMRLFLTIVASIACLAVSIAINYS